MSDNPNKIQRLQLENFTCFERADLEFSSGINVFIGENGTGKTHLLKVMYALNSGNYDHPDSFKSADFSPFVAKLFLEEYFGINNASSLTREEEKAAHINLMYEHGLKHHFPIRAEFESKDYDIFKELSVSYSRRIKSKKALMIPSNEMLSWFEGFVSAYENRETNIDPSYYYLAKALAPLPLKGDALEETLPLLYDLQESTRIHVTRTDDKFFVSAERGKLFEAKITAFGINKFAQLIYLILNGSLTKDTILFWDEPETGLNPKYIKIVAQFLQTLAKAGVQIFVATHDYLLVNYLSLAAEFREQTQAPDMKFFGLYKGKTGTEIETGATLSKIQNDAILEEYAAYYDLENEYFKQTVNGH